jgi:hypothetical protein
MANTIAQTTQERRLLFAAELAADTAKDLAEAIRQRDNLARCAAQVLLNNYIRATDVIELSAAVLAAGGKL